MVPSTSTVPRPTSSPGSGTSVARTSPMTGRSKSHRRLTVGWLTPNTARDLLCHVLPHQEHHHGHRLEQAQRDGAPTRDELVRASVVHQLRQIGELLTSQPCHSFVPQQLFVDPFSLPDYIE